MDNNEVIYIDQNTFIRSIIWHINSSVKVKLFNENEDISYVEFHNRIPFGSMVTFIIKHNKPDDLYFVERLNNPAKFFGCKEYDVIKVSETIKEELSKYDLSGVKTILHDEYKELRVGHFYHT